MLVGHEPCVSSLGTCLAPGTVHKTNLQLSSKRMATVLRCHFTADPIYQHRRAGQQSS